MKSLKNKERLKTIGIGVLIAVVISGLRLGFSSLPVIPIKVDGNSMYPNYEDGEFVFVDTRKTPGRLEVVVLDAPVLYGGTLIKRVIGLPGETIEIVNGDVLIDGDPLKELKVYQYEKMNESPPLKVILKENEYFVMGDNANHSADSRTEEIGVVDKAKIIGVVRMD